MRLFTIGLVAEKIPLRFFSSRLQKGTFALRTFKYGIAVLLFENILSCSGRSIADRLPSKFCDSLASFRVAHA